MLEIGWGKLVLIGIVALLVIGPKELPAVLRTMGQWMTKLRRMAERIAAYEQGSEGNCRRYPRCGQWQKYKGETGRELVFDCGTLTGQRA